MDAKTFMESLRRQVSKTGRYILVCLIFGLLVILAGWVVSLVKGIPASNLTRDPANTVGYPPYYGAQSFLGILLWAATATACFFVVAVVKKQDREYFRFFLVTGILVSFFLFDDLFLFHDWMFERITGLPENTSGVLYITFTIAYLVYFRRTLLKGDYLLLFLAYLFLGTSLLMDDLLPYSDLEAFYEDGPKFIGILFWATYFIRYAIDVVRVRLQGSTQTP